MSAGRCPSVLDVSLSLLGTRQGRDATPGRGRAIVASVVAAVALPLVATVVVLSLPGGKPAALRAALIVPSAVPSPTPWPLPSPTAAPTPTATPAPATDAPAPAPVQAAPAPPRAWGPPPPQYPVVGWFAAPSVGVQVTVVSVGLDRRGAMEAPEGPLGSAFWREGFWFRGGAVPGTPGTSTIAGHLDDIAGRPAAFWNIRQVQTGQEVTYTRASDGAVLRYKIVETDVWTDSYASQPAQLQRIYGGGDTSDGVSHLTLVTCTGRWVNGQYDHRFVAFAVLEL